ncbi:hypothetical protein WBJ53_15035 [Spirosoma sp. SC4-14]|uniref:hypothetical protein n=1 Tax=Spirosoma sp. SC4-14 TaxID=3128900 RepID=UPI0030CA8095
METTELILLIKDISSPEDMQRVRDTIMQMPGQMAPEVQQALLDKVAQVTAQSKAKREDAIAVLKVHGVEYPLTDWLTPKNYATKFGIKNTETVINWINRGVIDSENVKEIPELGLRLVRAIEYSPRKYSGQPVKA